MSSSKEIEIILQARLEQGSAIDSAKSLGSGIADAIEKAFDGLGQRIASNLILQMQTVLSNIRMGDFFNQNPQVTQGLQQNSDRGRGPEVSTIVDMNNRPYPRQNSNIATIEAPGGDQNRSSAPIAPPVQSMPNGTDAAAKATQDYDNRFLFGPRFGTGISQKFMGINGNADSPHFEELNEARRDAMGSGEAKNKQAQESIDADIIATRLQAFKYMRKADPEKTASPEFSEDLQKFKSFANNQIGANNKIIEDLLGGIQELSSTIKDLSGKEEELLKKEREGTISDKEKADLEALRSSRDALNKKYSTGDDFNTINKKMQENSSLTDKLNDVAGVERATEQASAMRGAKMFTAATAAGALIGTAGQYMSNSKILEMKDDAARAGLENANARDLISGNYEGIIATQMLGGEQALRDESRSQARWQVGGKIGASVAEFGGGALAAFYGNGLVGAGLGVSGAKTAYSAYEDYSNLDAVAQQRYKQMQNLKIEEQREYFTATRMGREMALNSFNTAQALGAPEIESELTGMDRSRGGTSLRSSAVRSKLSNQQFDQFIASMYGNMGGIIDGQNVMANKSVDDAMRLGFNMKGNGFSNFEQIAAGIFNASASTGNAAEDRASAMKESANLYAKALESGLDKLKIPQYLEQIVGRMNSRGYGGEGIEAQRALLAMGLSKSEGKKEGKDFLANQSTIDTIYQNVNSQDYWGTLARTQAVEDVAKMHPELGVISRAVQGNTGIQASLSVPGTPEQFSNLLLSDSPDLVRQYIKNMSKEETDEARKHVGVPNEFPDMEAYAKDRISKQAQQYYRYEEDQKFKNYIGNILQTHGGHNYTAAAMDMGPADTEEELTKRIYAMQHIMQYGVQGEENRKYLNDLKETLSPEERKKLQADDSTGSKIKQFEENSKLSLLEGGAKGAADSLDNLKVAANQLANRLEQIFGSGVVSSATQWNTNVVPPEAFQASRNNFEHKPRNDASNPQAAESSPDIVGLAKKWGVVPSGTAPNN